MRGEPRIRGDGPIPIAIGARRGVPKNLTVKMVLLNKPAIALDSIQAVPPFPPCDINEAVERTAPRRACDSSWMRRPAPSDSYRRADIINDLMMGR